MSREEILLIFFGSFFIVIKKLNNKMITTKIINEMKNSEIYEISIYDSIYTFTYIHLYIQDTT